MADISDKLDQIAEQFAGKVDLATSELVSYLRELVKGKTAAQSLEILSGINLEKAYELKLAKAFTAYDAGVVEFLKSTYTTTSFFAASTFPANCSAISSNLSDISAIYTGVVNACSNGDASAVSVSSTPDLSAR